MSKIDNADEAANRKIVEPILQRYLGNRSTRVRIYLGDPATGRDWMDENDVSGYIGQSMGPQKILLLIPTNRSYGGGGILTAHVLRIIANGREIYRHAKYKQPKWTIAAVDPSKEQPEGRMPYPSGYTTGTFENGKLHALFKSPAQAQRWLDFMEGRRMTK